MAWVEEGMRAGPGLMGRVPCENAAGMVPAGQAEGLPHRVGSLMGDPQPPERASSVACCRGSPLPSTWAIATLQSQRTRTLPLGALQPAQATVQGAM